MKSNDQIFETLLTEDEWKNMEFRDTFDVVRVVFNRTCEIKDAESKDLVEALEEIDCGEWSENRRIAQEALKKYRQNANS